MWLYLAFGKETPGAQKFRHMLLPLIIQGLLREALRKLTTANTMGFCCCYRQGNAIAKFEIWRGTFAVCGFSVDH
jgi:hypothetical protein